MRVKQDVEESYVFVMKQEKNPGPFYSFLCRIGKATSPSSGILFIPVR